MITIISGTNRKDSVTKQLALQYQKILKNHGEDPKIIDLEELPKDFIYSALYEKQGTNPEFNPIRELMKESQKYVFIVPEYNGSFPGILKTFLDALEFPDTLRGKKCAMIGLSAGMQGGVMAMSHLTDIFNYLGMHVLALKPKLTHISSKMKDGEVLDKSDLEFIEVQAKSIIEF